MKTGEMGGWKPLVMRIFFSLISIILVLVLIASVNFAIFLTHGDKNWLLLPYDSELREVVREEFRLDEHVVVQYFDYLASTLTGDFHTSTGVREFADVESLIYHNILGTIFLLAIVSVASILLGMVWGRCMKKNAEKAYGRFLHVLAVFSLSFPMFYLVVSLLVAANHLDIGFPIRGNGFDEGVVGVLQHAILPILSLMIAGSGFFALVTRAGLLRAERLGAGARPFRALDYANPFPYFLFPLVMIGVLSVDFVYSYGGLGTLVWGALRSMDLPVLMACSFMISVIVFFSQLAFRAVRERSRFMHPIDGILGPSEGTTNPVAIDLRPERHDKISISLLFSKSKKVAGAYLRHKSGVVAAIVLAIVLFLGLAAPPLNLYEHSSNILAPPGFSHLLGTDNLGRDLFNMNLHAAGTGMAVVLWTCVISVLCGLFVGFMSVVSSHYAGLLSRLRRYSMVMVSQSFLAILAPLILLGLLWSPYRSYILIDTNQILIRMPPIILLLVLSIYCWVYRTITWPLSNSLRSVRVARRWNETGKILRDSMSLFRCHSPLVLSRTLHITKYVVVLLFVFFSLSLLLAPLWPPLAGPLFGTARSWDYMLWSAYTSGAFALGSWWWIVPPLLGIVALAVSSYFCIDTLERVLDEQIESHTTLDQQGEETPDSDSDVAPGQGGADPDVPPPSPESSG